MGSLKTRIVEHMAESAEADIDERALPVTKEWLRPLCDHVTYPDIRWYLTNSMKHLCIVMYDGKCDIEWWSLPLIANANRGHVIDAMRLFGIEKRQECNESRG